MDTSHIHPMLVHFPVVLILLGFAVDFYSLFISKKDQCLSRFGLILMLLGTLGAVAGFYSGEYFTEELTGLAHEIKEQHEVYAKITMYTMIAASVLRLFWVWKKPKAKFWPYLIFVLLTIAAVFVGITGFTGGSLVYNVLLGY